MAGIPSPDRLWQRHEQLVINLFRLALTELKKHDSLPYDEPTLNEYLYLDVRKMYHKLPAGKRPIQIPVRNSEIPPRTVKEIGAPWTQKKPDFLCTLHNLSEKESSRAFKEYTIECKRLGRKIGSWDLIKEYVKNGIIRFFSSEHCYGIGTSSGAMIGYVQNMKFGEILSQINQAINSEKKHRIPVIVFDKWHNNQDEIENGVHHLQRKEVFPKNFDLHHYWLDLRN